MDPQTVLYRAASPGEQTVEVDPASTHYGTAFELPEPESHPTGFTAFEPMIGVTDDGTILFSAVAEGPDSAALSLVRGVDLAVVRSTDGGSSWSDVTPPTPGEGPVTLNDPYLGLDEDTGRVFATNTQAASCQVLSTSDDAGETWTTNPVGCGHPVGVHDHPTTFTAPPNEVDTRGYENVVYYCVNRVADAACATSLDGGQTFGPMRPLVFQGIQVHGPDGERVAENCSSLTAHGVGGPDGTAYLPSARCGGVPTVALSHDDGLTWERVVINETLTTRLQGTDPTTRLYDHEVPIAVDEAGNVYAAWIAEHDGHIYLAHSKDKGQTWSTAQAVTPPDVESVRFPTIDAQSPGRVAVGFVGTEDPRSPEEFDGTTTWNAYVAVTDDALDTAPLFVGAPTNPPSDPVNRGSCQDKCNGMGDFLDIELGPDGQPWGAFVDLCSSDCTAESGNDWNEGFVGTLDST